jgi:hypothetical protein
MCFIYPLKWVENMGPECIKFIYPFIYPDTVDSQILMKTYRDRIL